MITLAKEWKSGKDTGLLILRLTFFTIMLIYGPGFGKLATIFIWLSAVHKEQNIKTVNHVFQKQDGIYNRGLARHR